MEDSIFSSTKQVLGIPSDDTGFDVDLVTHINTAFSTLTQLGVGPTNGFMITDETDVWSDFITDEDPRWNLVRTYVYLKVRMYFDPPTTSYLKDAMESQIQELEVRMNILREESKWVAPA